MAKLKMIACDPTCGYVMKNHDQKELVDLTMMHAKRSHPDMSVTESQLKGMMKDA